MSQILRNLDDKQICHVVELSVMQYNQKNVIVKGLFKHFIELGDNNDHDFILNLLKDVKQLSRILATLDEKQLCDVLNLIVMQYKKKNFIVKALFKYFVSLGDNNDHEFVFDSLKQVKQLQDNSNYSKKYSNSFVAVPTCLQEEITNYLNIKDVFASFAPTRYEFCILAYEKNKILG